MIVGVKGSAHLDWAVIALFAVILAGMQVVATRRYGWRGLASATIAAIAVVFSARAIFEAWAPWKPSPLDEFGFYHGFFLLFFTLGNLFIVLVTAVLLWLFTLRDPRRIGRKGV